MSDVPLLRNTLSKKERLSGKAEIERLLSKAHYGNANCIRYCFAADSGEDCNRIMVSVPKKLFHRAVRRNLLKRRIRESYRTQKSLLPDGKGIDILFMYNSKDILDYRSVKLSMEKALKEISNSVSYDSNF